MKITNIEAYPVLNNTWNFVFVVVDTDEGIYGVGEAGSPGREQALIGLIEHFKPLLIGQDPQPDRAYLAKPVSRVLLPRSTP